MTTIDQITNILAPLMPIVEKIVTFMIPIYIAIGAFFQGFAEAFLTWLSFDDMVFMYIFAGLIFLGGIAWVVFGEMKVARKNKE